MTSSSIARIRPAAPHPIRKLFGEPLAETANEWTDDVRQFLVGWLAGLVFFGTFLA